MFSRVIRTSAITATRHTHPIRSGRRLSSLRSIRRQKQATRCKKFKDQRERRIYDTSVFEVHDTSVFKIQEISGTVICEQQIPKYFKNNRYPNTFKQTDNQRIQSQDVVTMHNLGYKQAEIGKALEISQPSVSKILKNQREAGNLKPSPPSLGENVAIKRQVEELQRKGFTQTNIAKSLGISQASVSKISSGKISSGSGKKKNIIESLDPNILQLNKPKIYKVRNEDQMPKPLTSGDKFFCFCLTVGVGGLFVWAAVEGRQQQKRDEEKRTKEIKKIVNQLMKGKVVEDEIPKLVEDEISFTGTFTRDIWPSTTDFRFTNNFFSNILQNIKKDIRYKLSDTKGKDSNTYAGYTDSEYVKH
jgi:predicted transcriptional regulator